MRHVTFIDIVIVLIVIFPYLKHFVNAFSVLLKSPIAVTARANWDSLKA